MIGEFNHQWALNVLDKTNPIDLGMCYAHVYSDGSGSVIAQSGRYVCDALDGIGELAEFLCEWFEYKPRTSIYAQVNELMNGRPLSDVQLFDELYKIVAQWRPL